MSLVRPVMCMLALAISAAALSQAPPTTDQFIGLPGKFFPKVEFKIGRLDSQLTKQTQKYLRRFAKLEAKIKRQLSRIDTSTASQLFGNGTAGYEQLLANMKVSGNSSNKISGEYIAYLDSLETCFAFLEQTPGILKEEKRLAGKAKQSLAVVQNLKSKLQAAEEVKRFIAQRKQQLKEALARYGKLPRGITKQLQHFNKELYYYSQQLREYRDILNDPDKLSQKALSLLNKVPAFREFFRKNSQLASMFRLPGETDPLDPPSLYGLQTRLDIQLLLQQRIGNDPAANQQLQQNLQEAQQHIQQLKNKMLQNISKGGYGEEDLDFKPNNQKTKSFTERLEIGINVQSQKPNGWFPAISDFGLSLGYKLTDKSVIGIGASYKLGWGESMRHIKISHQGLALRGFIDWKLKGSFWLSGGYEQNYLNEINRIEQLQQFSAWQQSGLIGLTKVISIKTKFLKQTKLQLLWDFLSRYQPRRSNPIVFRVGYNLK